jgi:hypothetical protein
MDRLNKGQTREFTAVYIDVFSRQRIDPKDYLSEFKVTHMTDNVGEVTDIDWQPMLRKQLGYYVYFLDIDDRFDVGRQYNVYFRGYHPVDNGETLEMEQYMVIDRAAEIEGMLMSASFCNVSGGAGYPCR